VLSQINRAVEHRANKRPTLADLSGSGGLESASDVALLLYRDDYYDKGSPEPNVLEVNVAKQRNGPTGVVKLVFNRTTQRMQSLAVGRSDTG
jgi:replicative DNA helicase